MTDTTSVNVNVSQLDLLSKLLDATGLRHRVLAHNIANVNTPGFHKLNVAFEDALSREIGKGGQAALGNVKPKVTEDKVSPERADGNNVDIDIEMGNMDKNALLYNVYSQILASRIGTMRSAISGR
jgi:flagellar basal-body rod protein FlgB